jgi:hypothetical protein
MSRGSAIEMRGTMFTSVGGRVVLQSWVAGVGLLRRAKSSFSGD